jgi:hypothetical protein
VFHFHYISRAVTARRDGSLCSVREANGFSEFFNASCEKRDRQRLLAISRLGGTGRGD